MRNLTVAEPNSEAGVSTVEAPVPNLRRGRSAHTTDLAGSEAAGKTAQDSDNVPLAPIKPRPRPRRVTAARPHEEVTENTLTPAAGGTN